MSAKVFEAKEHCKAAEKAMKTGVFRWKPDYDSAADEYSQAAQCYRIARDLPNSKECHLKASECFKKNNAFFHAAKSLENAMIVCKETASAEEIYNLASESANLYQQHGSGDSGAGVLDKGAKIIENASPELAVRLFQQAADVSSCMELTEGEAPEVTEAAMDTVVSEDSEAPNATEASEDTEVLKATGAPEVMDAPEVTEALMATEAPIATEAPMATEASDDTEVLQATGAPEVIEALMSTEAPMAMEASEETEVQKATGAADVIEATEALEVTVAPVVREAPEVTEALMATEVPKATEASEDMEVLKATGAPDVMEATEALKASEVTDAPIATGAPEVKEAPIATGAPEVKEAPIATGAPEVKEAPIATGAPEVKEAPIATGAPEVTEAPITTGSPEEPAKVEVVAQEAETESSQHQGSEYISKASRILVKLQWYDQAVDSLRREIGFHQESGNTGAIGRLTVAIVLVQLARGDTVAAEKAYKEWGSNCEVAEMQTLEQILQAYDEEDRESAKRALASSFIRNMDVEYARLAATVPLPEAMEPAPRAAVRENAAPSYVSPNAQSTTTADVSNEEIEESPYEPVTYVKKSDDEDGLC